MQKKRKISVRKVLRALVTVIASASCLVAVLASSGKQAQMPVKDINLHITNEQYKFIDREVFWDEVIGIRGIQTGKTKITQVDVHSMEADALKNPWIDKSEAYIDNMGSLHLTVTQRVPAARVFFENGQSFYIDDSLRLLPLSEYYTMYTTIVTNVPHFADDSLNKVLRSKIVSLVRFIDRDTFWSAQVAQVIANPDMTFELIPVLGTHKIQFGDAIDIEKKFTKLFAFYKKVLNRIGWSTYENLDLRFDGQIVASPTVPWKPSVRNPISNMNWLKNIMGEPPRDTDSRILKAVVGTSNNVPVRTVQASSSSVNKTTSKP